MILKAFKENSNQKYLERQMASRPSITANRKIETVGIILNAAEFSDADGLKNFFHELGLQLPKITVVLYVEEEKKGERLWGNYFSKKDIGWRGKIKHPELQSFVDTPFDALLGFYQKDLRELKLITASSKAEFKIGLAGVDNRLYDLIFDLAIQDVDLFKSELKKYLTILKKI